jgi:hypothetical protein
MEHSPNSWKLWRRNFGQAWRQWTLAFLPVFFPLAITGAMPLKFNKSPGNFEPVAIGAEGRQQSWGQCRAGSGQIVKEETIGMRAENFSDPPFVLSDERQKTLELAGQQFNSQGVGSDDGEVSGQGLGFLDKCQAL